MYKKRNLLIKKILEEKYKNSCEKVYERAYQSFIEKLLRNENNSNYQNISPIKLERSINIIK